MNNVGVIDTFLNTFTTYIDSGFGLIKGEVTYLSSTLIVIDITLAGLFWAWGADEDILQRLVKKTLYIGFFAFIITNFTKLSGIIFNSFASLGLKAGGSSISTADFLRPGRLAQVGLDAGQPLLDAASQMMGFTSFFANFVQIAVLMVSWLLVLIAFFILAVQLFVTLIEFKLTTLAGFILIPFALFNKTAFLAEKVLGNVVASGVKVMVLAVIVGIGTGLFSPVHHRLCRRPADDRAGALCRARGARYAGPRHLRAGHRDRACFRRAAAWCGRYRRHGSGCCRYSDGRRRGARFGRKGSDGSQLWCCGCRAWRCGDGGRHVLRLQPRISRSVRRRRRRVRSRRCRPCGG
ncbi:P-type conjugative transfer protein TrbL [Bradyrhizobium diazoefficiens]